MEAPHRGLTDSDPKHASGGPCSRKLIAGCGIAIFICLVSDVSGNVFSEFDRRVSI